MIYSENALNVLVTKTYKGIGRAWIIKNLKGNETVDGIVFLLNKNAKIDYCITVKNFEENKEKIRENTLQKLENFVDGLVAIGDIHFPCCRGKVKNSERPVTLFYRGDLNLLKLTNKNIAVIGLLNPDKEIELIEQEVVTELVENGATIISGLALGCDTIAHKQTLRLGGTTIAILPSPLDNILPIKNQELAHQIVDNGGLLITEYHENIKSRMELSGRYKDRDRLQALLSDYIVLSASYAKNNQGNDSGARLAMEYALSYSIPRAVIYDPTTDINNRKYDLNRELIKEDATIIIINRGNLASVTKKLLFSKSDTTVEQLYQQSLFDSLPLIHE